MNVRLTVATSVVALSLTACGPQDTAPDADGTWVGTITTEGNVTTVVNESGSVWGGTARLVEELSIGVDAGADEYMFGHVYSVAVHDGRLYVLDGQVPVVRVYDREGRHVEDIGRSGQGPGEFEQPGEFAIAPDGTVYVKDGLRIAVFPGDGSAPSTWTNSNLFAFSVDRPLVVTPDGVLWAPTVVERVGLALADWIWGMVPIGPGEVTGEPSLPPRFDLKVPKVMAEILGVRTPVGIPFVPEEHWVMAPQGSIVAGATDEYRIEVHRSDGSVLVVHKEWEPIGVERAEADWHRRRRVDFIRRFDPEWAWDGDEIPSTKPAFEFVVPDHGGRLWVIRPGVGYRKEECDDGEPCWLDREIVDVFGPDGRFLGVVDVPPGVIQERPRPYIRDAMVIAPIVDDAGTIMVKRYRLVLPGEQ